MFKEIITSLERIIIDKPIEGDGLTCVQLHITARRADFIISHLDIAIMATVLVAGVVARTN